VDEPLFSGGKLLWSLNDKRCKNFKVCGIDGDKATGTAKVRASSFTEGHAMSPLLCRLCESPPHLSQDAKP
jgi:hypothetical protein